MNGERPGERHAEDLSSLTLDDLFVRDDLDVLAETFQSDRLTSMAHEFTALADGMEADISDAQAALDMLRHQREVLRRRAEIHVQAAQMARSLESME